MENVNTGKKPALEIAHSANFISWLNEQQTSIAFTTYQSKRLFLVGLKQNGRLSVFERMFDHAMGLYTTSERLYLSTKYQIWQFDNVVNDDELYDGYDRLYIPRTAYTTGHLDIHDVVVDKNGKLFFVNTMFNCIASLSDKYSFTPEWKPSYISTLTPEDRCHLNGLALCKGKPKYATSVSQSDIAGGWRDERSSGGCVIDIENNDIVSEGLSMPHSPRFYGGRLWLLNSGMGDFGYIDMDNGSFNPVTFCNGYLRGLAFHQNYAIVGLSKPRHNKTFIGLPLQERLTEKKAEPVCGLLIIDLDSGNVVHWMMLEGVTTELYDVQVLPGVKCPKALGLKTDEIERIIYFQRENKERTADGFTLIPSANHSTSNKYVDKSNE